MKKLLSFSFLFLLSFLMVGCSQSLKSQAKLISNYEMNIVFDDVAKTLQVNQHVEYKNNSDYMTDKVCFHLYPSAFRENTIQKVVSLEVYSQAYPNGTSYGGIEILNVFDNKNENMEFQITGYDENILQVDLDEKLYPDDKVDININYTVTLPNINHRFGYGENAVNLANFYPIACVFENGKFIMDPYSSNGDPFYSDVANYIVNFSYPDNFVLASSGNQEDTVTHNGISSTRISALVIRDFAMVLSDKFVVISSHYEDTKVYYYYYDDENAEKSLETSVLALKTYSETFGTYPYNQLSVVQTNFVHGGMEYPNLVYISDDIKEYKSYTNVIAHEIAHQWWYAMVGNNEYSNAWLDEGLTEYSTALFYELNPQYEIELKDLMLNGIKIYSYYTQVYSAVYKELDTSMTRSLDEYTNENEYVYICYVKGMLLFDSLRQLVGDEKFFSGLRFYFDNYQFKNASSEDIIWAFESVTNYSLENFFMGWLDGKVIIMSLAG